jgi:hypothetical protein
MTAEAQLNEGERLENGMTQRPPRKRHSKTCPDQLHPDRGGLLGTELFPQPAGWPGSRLGFA